MLHQRGDTARLHRSGVPRIVARHFFADRVAALPTGTPPDPDHLGVVSATTNVSASCSYSAGAFPGQRLVAPYPGP